MRHRDIIETALVRYLNNEKISVLSEDYQIPVSTLYKKIRKLRNEKYNDKLPGLLSKLYDYERKIDRLEKDNSIFRDAFALMKLNNKEIYEILDALNEQHNDKHALCRVFNIARLDYYHHLRKKDKKTKIGIEDEHLRKHIHKIFHDSEQRYGKKN